MKNPRIISNGVNKINFKMTGENHDSWLYIITGLNGPTGWYTMKTNSN